LASAERDDCDTAVGKAHLTPWHCSPDRIGAARHVMTRSDVSRRVAFAASIRSKPISFRLSERAAQAFGKPNYFRRHLLHLSQE